MRTIDSWRCGITAMLATAVVFFFVFGFVFGFVFVFGARNLPQPLQRNGRGFSRPQLRQGLGRIFPKQILFCGDRLLPTCAFVFLHRI